MPHLVHNRDRLLMCQHQEGKAVQWAQDELKDKGKSDNTTC